MIIIRLNETKFHVGPTQCAAHLETTRYGANLSELLAFAETTETAAKH